MLKSQFHFDFLNASVFSAQVTLRDNSSIFTLSSFTLFSQTLLLAYVHYTSMPALENENQSVCVS